MLDVPCGRTIESGTLESDDTLRNEEIDNMPMRYSDTDLEMMMDDAESDLVERKEAWAGGQSGESASGGVRFCQ